MLRKGTGWSLQSARAPYGGWQARAESRSDFAWFGESHTSSALAEAFIQDLLRRSNGQPVVIHPTDKRKYFFIYRGNFYISQEQLTGEEFVTLATALEAKRDRTLQRARNVVQAGNDGGASPRGGRVPISTEVQNAVWQRDQGRCVRCGSQCNLEFDHVIPVSKGGSNTARNLQLLCETCNRSKGANLV